MGDAEWRQQAPLLPKHPQVHHLQNQQQLQQQMHFHFNSVDQELNSLSTSATGTAPARPPAVRHLATHGFGGVDMGSTVGRRPPGMPPVSPGSRSFASQQSPSAASNHSAPGHSRSLSQPAGFFSLDQLPPLSPPLNKDTSSPSSVCEQSRGEASMEVRDVSGLPRPVASPSSTPVPLIRSNSGGLHAAENLPPRKAHRRSYSDVPLAFMEPFQYRDVPPSLPPRPHNGIPDCSTSPRDIYGLLQQQQAQFIKQESDCDSQLDGGRTVAADKKCDDETMEALIGDEYINFEALDAMNSSEMDDKHDHSRASGTKNSAVDTSENESESSVNESGGSTQAFVNLKSCFSNKRRGVTDMAVDIGPRHCRSLSVDSCLISKVDFGIESPKLPPSPGVQPPCLSRANSLDGTSDKLRMELGTSDLSGAEVKKLIANAKLAEIAAQDPKRAKRIWANRQSAARSKERKQKYISELEHKVQTLQTEATTLSTQLTVLQRDSTELTSHNRELKLKLQAMEQQAQLRDALNDALSAEVQRLKLATAGMGSSQPSAGLPQPTLNPQFFQFQHQLQQMQPQSAMPFCFQDNQSEQEQQREAEHHKQCQSQMDQNISGRNKEPMASAPMSEE